MELEIWIDVLFPWCWIDTRRLDAVRADFEHRDEVELVWRGWEILPELPREPGEPLLDLMHRLMSIPRAELSERYDRVRRLGTEEGVDIDLHGSFPVNSFDAHRVIHHAASEGRRGELTERLYRAYFSEHLNVADHDVLARLAGQAGLDAEEVRALLAGDAYADAVRADQARGAEIGAGGEMPAIAIDGTVVARGEQTREQLLGLLERAHSPTASPSNAE